MHARSLTSRAYLTLSLTNGCLSDKHIVGSTTGPEDAVCKALLSASTSTLRLAHSKGMHSYQQHVIEAYVHVAEGSGSILAIAQF